MTNIGLVKFLSSKFSDDLMAGRLYMNNLEYFRQLEGEGALVQSDKHEGLEGFHKSSAVIFSTGEQKFTLRGDVSIHPSEDRKNLKIFCMTGIRAPCLSCHPQDGIALDSRWNRFHDEHKKHSNEEYRAVVILQPAEFIRRVKETVGSSNSTLSALAYIEYLSQDQSQCSMTPMQKFNAYEWQSEFRIIVDDNHEKADHLVLDIGDINDISVDMRFDHFINGKISTITAS